MKKLFTLLVASLCTLSVWAEDFSVNGIYYNFLGGDEVEVTYAGAKGSSIKEYSDTVVVPATVEHLGNTYQVSRIGKSAFAFNTNLYVVVLPEGIRSIGERTFEGCTGLVNVNIPKSVSDVEWDAFINSGILKDQTNWENDVLYIDDCLVKVNTSKADTLNIKEGTRLICYSACNGCKLMKHVTFPNSIVHIGASAFNQCANLQSLYLHNGVETIGEYAFANTSIKSMVVPESVTYIGGYAFNNTFWLTNQANGLVYIHKVLYTYKGNMSANTSIEVKDGTVAISSYALYQKNNLTSITLPESIRRIGGYAFSECEQLESFHIHDGVTIIEKNCFEWCYALKTLRLPKTLLHIEESAIKGCRALGSIVIPDGVLSIGSSAFSGCKALKSVTVPNSVTKLGTWVFNGCDSLNFAQIGDQVRVVPDYTFCDCKQLTTLVLGSGVETLGAWALQRCSGLTELYCKAEEVPALNRDDMFYNVHTDSATLYVPFESLELYQNAPQWKDFYSILPISELPTSSPMNQIIPIPNTQKLLRDGQLIIIRDGIEYNAVGGKL